MIIHIHSHIKISQTPINFSEAPDFYSKLEVDFFYESLCHQDGRPTRVSMISFKHFIPSVRKGS